VIILDILALVQLCGEYISGVRRFVGKPEEETKQMLIEPLLANLGWSSTHAQEYYDREYLGKVKGVEWKDIALIINNRPRAFIEAKACTDKHIHEKYSRDLLKYLKNYNADKPETDWVSWGILTNFTETFLYHWSEPTRDPKPFYSFSYQQLSNKFQDLKDILSPEGVRNNRLLNRFYETPGHKLDEEFLKDLKKWRKIIANAFYLKNMNLTIEQISEISHVFLSRLIFLRRLEAIGVLKPRWVRSQYEAWKEGKTIPTATLSDYIRMLFDGFWRFYDTELFEEQECDRFDFDDQFFEELLKDFDVASRRVREIVGIQEPPDKGLYGYNFMELSLDILGAVYERYLAHTLGFKQLSNGKKVITIEETAKLRQREGAYFTPTHIVRFILVHTLEPRLSAIYTGAVQLLKQGKIAEAKKRILDIGKIRVLDPSCGSGSFLIEAFKMITSYYSLYNASLYKAFRGAGLHEQKVAEYEIDKVGERTLLENIYGVDLDAKAVELTKLNLWLNHIDLNRTSYYYSGGPAKRKLLPPLDLNIQTGNSMVCHDESDLEAFKVSLENIKAIRNKLRHIRGRISLNTDGKEVFTLQKQNKDLSVQWRNLVSEIENTIKSSLLQYLVTENEEDFRKPFNWHIRFPEVFDDGGFDVYVGNPPYINLYKFSGQFRDYLEKRDNEIFTNKNDLLYHFYKRGIELLREGGSLGYITSRYFLEAENADRLREWFPKNARIKILIDWGNVELFQGINTRCVVMILDKSIDLEQNLDNTVSVAKIKNWKNKHSVLTEIIGDHIGTDFYQPPNISIFHILESELTKEPWRLLNTKEKEFRTLLEQNAWRLGGDDGICDIGMGMQTGLDRAFRVTSSEIESEEISLEFLRKLVRNGDIRKYFLYDRDEYWIYTEDIDIDELSKDHPVKKHVLKYYDKLIHRYPCRTSPEQPIPKRKWYQYTVPNIKELFTLEEKIVVPYKAPSNRFAMDNERRISSMDVYVLAIKTQYRSTVSGWYVLAVLNSNLMDYAYITFYGRRKKSEFDYYTGLIERIPIARPSSNIHDRLGDLAKELTELNRIRIAALDTFEKLIKAETHKEVKLQQYYDNATAYQISHKEVNFKESQGENRPKYEVYRIGVEEKDTKLLFEAGFRRGEEKTRQKVLEIAIDNQSIRKFLLFSVKLFIEKNRSRKILGKHEPLDVILRIRIPKFKSNIKENIIKISNLMDEFDSKHIIDQGLSEVERKIIQNARKIDGIVMDLYGLNNDQRQMITELYKVGSVSEYFDRLEEYVGFEDTQLQ
jgi:hypothetical protein